MDRVDKMDGVELIGWQLDRLAMNGQIATQFRSNSTDCREQARCY